MNPLRRLHPERNGAPRSSSQNPVIHSSQDAVILSGAALFHRAVESKACPEPAEGDLHCGCPSEHPEPAEVSPVLGPGRTSSRATSTKLGLPALLAVAVALAAPAQSPLFHDPNQPVGKTQQVQYLYPEQVTLPAGKPQSVTLHFRIAPGLHINSHSPSDQFLIPTVLSLPANAGVSLAAAHYPDGVEYILPADPSTKLNVYTGDFAIEARLLATPGDHLVQVHLRFQACDENACMPPRTITAAIDVIAR